MELFLFSVSLWDAMVLNDFSMGFGTSIWQQKETTEWEEI